MNPKEHLVLYVDDEKANRIVFEQSFAQRFRVQTVASGRAALEVLKEDPVAVLVTDQRMPEMSGQELLKQAKLLYPDTIRVVMTAYSDLDPILSAVNEGLVARYVIKPWDRTELAEILLWAVEAFAASREDSALQLRLMQTERLVTLGSIMASVLHDFRQPLSMVLLTGERFKQLARSAPALATLLALPEPGISAEDRAQLEALVVELPDYAGDLLESGRGMHNITEGVRDFLNKRRVIETPTAEPLPIIRSAISICRETAMRARAHIVYEGPAELPKVRINQTELSQVLINLVANAAQALVDGGRPGGHVVVQADVREPAQAASAAPPMVRFAVSDDGPGMSEEILQRVGKPFFSTRLDGTGLGVAQCMRLVKKAGGDLTIESKEGAGTTVHFTLPRAT